MEGDTPIHRKTFLEMTEPEQIVFLEQLREKRLEPINTYNDIIEAKKQKQIAKLNTKQEKELAQFEKCLEKVDKYLEELSNRANKLRMIKMQLEFTE